jgi:hypothetical protein
MNQEFPFLLVASQVPSLAFLFVLSPSLLSPLFFLLQAEFPLSSLLSLMSVKLLSTFPLVSLSSGCQPSWSSLCL